MGALIGGVAPARLLPDGHNVATHSFRLQTGAPCTLFIPAVQDGPHRRLLSSLAEVAAGYLHVIAPGLRRWPLASKAIGVILRLLLAFVPAAWQKVPCVEGGAPLVGQWPLFLFSHGLTGTSDEHTVLFTALARKGFAVATLTHTDGSASSCNVSGTLRFYEHVDFKNYDRDFRPKQVQRRAQEMLELKDYLLRGSACPVALQSNLDKNRVFVGGFSYGAATAALCCVKDPAAFAGAILMDGWFHMALPKLNPPFVLDFPAEVHASGLHCPALFIGSEQFEKVAGVREATQRLAEGHESVVLPGTTHFNFQEASLVWVSPRLCSLVGAIGTADAVDTHQQILSRIEAFLTARCADVKTSVAASTPVTQSRY